VSCSAVSSAEIKLPIRLIFREGQNSAWFVADGVAYAVDLDGLFRFTAPPAALQVPSDAARMLRGAWIDADTFVMDLRIVGRVSSYIETLQFQSDRLTLREDYYVSGDQYITSGFAPLKKHYRKKS